MKLIVIYGPPAAGKLTVAAELAKQTGYKLFHNHLTMDLARELYPEFGELRFGLVDKLRLDTFEYAAKHGTDLIFTIVYHGEREDDSFFDDVVEVVTRHGGEVVFVELQASHEVLLGRVENESRKRFHKLIKRDVLAEQLEAGRYMASPPGLAIFKLDSTSRTPAELAELIIDHYQLPKP